MSETARGLDSPRPEARPVPVLQDTLVQFDEIVAELAADDDIFEFRRLLASEARRA